MRLKRIVPFLLILVITSVFFVFAFGGKAVRSQSAAPCSSTYAPGSPMHNVLLPAYLMVIQEKLDFKTIKTIPLR